MYYATVSKEYIFDAAHYILGHSKCGELHGHTWTMNVSVEGPLDMKTGMVLDFHIMNDIIRPIVKQLDHSTLNSNPLLITLPIITAETLAMFLVEMFAKKFEPHFPGMPYTVEVAVQEGLGGVATAAWSCEVVYTDADETTTVQ